MSTSQGIKLDEATIVRLKALAKQRDRTPHWLMRTAIDKYLEHEERYELERKEDTARWEAYLLTGNAVDHKKVEGWLDDLASGKLKPWPK